MRPARATLARLRRRPAVAALLLYQFAFLNLFLPGHTRGAITLDPARGCAACCCGQPADSRPRDRQPTESDRHSCAVCHFAARVVPPPTVDLRPPHLGLLHLLPTPPPAVVVLPDVIPTYLGRGPPAAHA